MTQKTERLNMRLSKDALERLKAAANWRQQDLTSFVLGAALEKADELSTLKVEKIRFSRSEYEGLARLIESEEIPPGLSELFDVA